MHCGPEGQSGRVPLLQSLQLLRYNLVLAVGFSDCKPR